MHRVALTLNFSNGERLRKVSYACEVRVNCGNQREAWERKMATRPANALHKTLLIGALTLEVEEVGVGYARAELSKLIRDSAASGRAFLIRNARDTTAPSVLLLSPEVLSELLIKPAQRRTLGEIVDSLPSQQTRVPRLLAGLPSNTLRKLRGPDCSKSS